jgi:hypothetical protein
VFIYDAIQVFRREAAVPGAFGVDQGDRALFADAEAADFAAVDAAGVRGAVEGGSALLEACPGGFAFRGGAAVSADAEEDVAFVAADATAGGLLAGLIQGGFWLHGDSVAAGGLVERALQVWVLFRASKPAR